jgi:TRAP-type C4-dicarboxylate transport system permease small subunit
MEKQIGKILKYGTLISTYLLISSVLLQIFSRFLLNNTPAWTEEASRLFFIYAVSFASGIALKNNYYVHLDLFFDQFSQRTKKICLVIITSSTLLLFVIMTWYALQFVILGNNEYSPSMKIRMSLVFFSMVVMGASISYYAFNDVKKAIKNLRS